MLLIEKNFGQCVTMIVRLDMVIDVKFRTFYLCSGSLVTRVSAVGVCVLCRGAHDVLCDICH